MILVFCIALCPLNILSVQQTKAEELFLHITNPLLIHFQILHVPSLKIFFSFNFWTSHLVEIPGLDIHRLFEMWISTVLNFA